jgi:hypothetical protein
VLAAALSVKRRRFFVLSLLFILLFFVLRENNMEEEEKKDSRVSRIVTQVIGGECRLYRASQQYSPYFLIGETWHHTFTLFFT